MSSRYEIYLTDDKGKHLLLLNRADGGFAFFSYSRVISGYGTFQIGIPYRQFKEQVYPVFAPDRRIEVWRSPSDDHPLRLEGIYLLRRENIYTREEDGIEIIEFYARSPIDLLSRRWVIQAAGTTYTAKEAALDDMMKEIVREQMLWGNAVDKDGIQDNSRAYPVSEFSVQADLTLGPVLARRFADRNVLDFLKELKDTSFQLNEDNPATNRRIYFDIVPNYLKGMEVTIPGVPTDAVILDDIYVDWIAYEMLGYMAMDELGGGTMDVTVTSEENAMGLQFQTFADLRGIDRTSQLVFSVENSNLKGPQYVRNHFDEKNSAIIKGSGRGESRSIVVVNDDVRIDESRWNRCETIHEANYEVDDTELQSVGAAQLKEGQPVEEIFATFLNTGGSQNVPRSLYGIDWDLGDLVNVWYAGKSFECEIVVVYVAIDDGGVETITGRNTIGESV